VAWHGRLDIDYHLDNGRTVAHSRHEGPLRVLKSLYPEGPGICHQVLLHPPAGLVGGDRLDIRLRVGIGTHAVLTTPGATRFYRSDGETATQDVELELAEGARCEWLPLETIAYSGCMANNRVTIRLAERAQVIGWDVLALGLPATGVPFERGWFEQTLLAEGIWREHGRLAADDRLLLDGPSGLAGQRVLGTAWWVGGTPLADGEREAMVQAARSALASLPAAPRVAAVTSPEARSVVMRCLTGHTEAAAHAVQAVRSAWRESAWRVPGGALRIWST
jgi:urease accessory protein